MLASVLFLLFGIWVLWHSYRMLIELVGPLEPGEPVKKRGLIYGLIYVGGLLIWFSVGVIALSISIMKFTNKAILLLQ